MGGKKTGKKMTGVLVSRETTSNDLLHIQLDPNGKKKREEVKNVFEEMTKNFPKL